MPMAMALPLIQMALPFIGKLFGGGAPTFDDLTKNTKDTSNMLTGAVRQSQDLRGDQISKSRELQDIDINNARSVGGFDPAALGANFQADPDNPWAHLAGVADQFAGADFGARGLEKGFEREQGILQLVNQLASQAGSMNLGIDNMLMQGGQAAGGGMGTAVGAAGAALPGVIGALTGGGGGGGTAQGFNTGGGGSGLGGLLGQLGVAGPAGGGGGGGIMPTSGGPSFGTGPVGSGGGAGFAPGGGGGGFDASSLIQSIINGVR